MKPPPWAWPQEADEPAGSAPAASAAGARGSGRSGRHGLAAFGAAEEDVVEDKAWQEMTDTETGRAFYYQEASGLELFAASIYQ